jgi:hypothetical protein
MKSQHFIALLCLFMTLDLFSQSPLQKGKDTSQKETSRKQESNSRSSAVGGNVGINTSTPAYPLEVVGNPGYNTVLNNTTDGVRLGNYLDGGGAWIGTISNHPILFYTNDGVTANMQIDTSGKVFIGNTFKSGNLHVLGGAILSQNEGAIDEQLLIGTDVANDVAKVLIRNTAYPHALKIDGKGSTSGTAVVVDGNINVSGSISKGSGTFMIDHPVDPLNKYLYHSFVESPDMMNVYNGNTITDKDGNATVQLPSYFEALNMDYRYQLTTIGQFAQAIVFEKVKDNSFKIKTDKPNVEVSWQVTGIRNDAYARQNRVQTEVPKPESEKGKYLHPTAFQKAQ